MNNAVESDPTLTGASGPAPAVLATLVITFCEDGSVRADGPLNNKLLSYGLLESAKDIVRNYHTNLLANQARVAQGEVPKELDVVNPLGKP